MTALLHAEWTKVRSAYAMPLTLLAGLLISLALGLVNGLSAGRALDTDPSLVRPDFDPVDSGFVGLLYGHLAYVAFAALAVTSEYTSGTIGTSLAAVPRRWRFYAAKLAVVAGVAAVVASITAVAGFALTETALGRHGVALDGAVVGPLVGAAAYVTLICVLSSGVAAMLRGSALTLGVLLPLFFAVSPVLNGIAATRPVARYLPDHAGAQMFLSAAPGGDLPPWQGLVVLLGWTAAAVLGGGLATRLHDVGR